jgi:hydrogenase maturation protease
MPTSGSVEPGQTAPVLLLGLGNPLMADDGAGQELLSKLESHASTWGHQVEFVDGGTQGLALLGLFEGREAVVFLDAIRLGDQPGAVHVLRGQELMRMGARPATTAHEGSAPQILAALELLGETPKEITMIGLEPEKIGLGMGLSPSVQDSLGMAAGFARMAVNEMLERRSSFLVSR